MEWTIQELESFKIIDGEIASNSFSPAEYEILRQVIFYSADFDFQHSLRFAARALQSGAAALVSRATIIVDVPMVQAGLVPQVQNTFGNSVLCANSPSTLWRKSAKNDAQGIKTLALRYPEGIFVIGQQEDTLMELLELVELEEIQPALIIGTPSGFGAADVAKYRLYDSNIPYILTNGRKGGAVVAVAIVYGLLNLSWEVYEHHKKNKLTTSV